MPDEGLAAGKNEHGPAESRHFIDQRFGLGSGQFIGIRLIQDIQPAAMDAAQITAGRGFPIDAFEVGNVLGHPAIILTDGR